MDLKKKKLFLLDMDGTIYLENELFDGSKEFIEKIRQIGHFVFITNNSSKSVEDYVRKVQSMGIDVEYENFYTSSQATALYLKRNYQSKKIYVVGTRSLMNELEKYNLNVTDLYSDCIECVTIGYDTELNYRKLVDSSKLLTAGAAFVATNPDLVCPTSFGYVPDCGSFCQMLFNATGKSPVYIGKPEPEMILQAIEKTSYSKNEAILVGDRMYTDIKSGVNANITTALVLSGETKKEDLKNYDFNPDYIYNSVYNLYLELSEYI